MRVLVDRPLKESMAVKVEAEDMLMLGEVCYSIPSETGFEVGLQLEHSLVGLQELARLNQQLLAGWEAPTKPDVTGRPILLRGELLEYKVAASRR
jgi:hypothetical protein